MKEAAMRQWAFGLLLPFLLFPDPLAGEDFAAARRNMVKNQIEARGVKDRRVLDALLAVERHLFVPQGSRGQAYADYPLPIGEGQTISQPYIVALMSEALALTGTEKVLEIGTGSGYQAAVLSRLCREVYTVEIRPPLSEAASRLLSALGYGNVRATCADGYFGWKEKAPFDRIMITAAVDHVPPPLIEQLADGGRLILPLGSPFGTQELVLVTRKGKDLVLDYILGVLFVPMTGEALQGR
jgi:protein-L-isoaspartate(D-aspartate) O-methyltransferase